MDILPGPLPPLLPSVLVVEDNPDLGDWIQQRLCAEGHEVVLAHSGLAALVQASRRRFGAVLLDLENLSGLGGQWAIRYFSRVPCIVLAARTGAWKEEALAAGASACLSRPFAIEDLLALLRTVSARRGAFSPFPRDVRALGPEALSRISQMAGAELDALPFGAIRVDGEGRIRAFNAFESSASGCDGSVLGRPFREVAPSAGLAGLSAELEAGLAAGQLDRTLRLAFRRRAALCMVSVRLFLDPESGDAWILVSAPRGEPVQAVEEARQAASP